MSMATSDKTAPAVPTVEGHLASLRIVPLASLVPHEQADTNRVERLAGRISEDRLLKNPVIVTPIPDSDSYMVMDGANRTAALGRAGARDALVQVVGYDDQGVALGTWNHLISGIAPNDLLNRIAGVPDIELRLSPIETARQQLQARGIIGYLVHPPHDEKPSEVYTICMRSGSERPESDLLLDMVNIYKGDPQAVIHRVSNDEIDEYLPYYGDASALLVFPPYTPEDLLELARNGLRVPTGITRHVIPARALRVNVPLDILSSNQMSAAEKNEWWLDLIRGKLARNEIRFYQESTYLFDE